MGDRTSVELTVLTKHAEQVEAVDSMGGETHSVNDDTTSYLYYDINYGDLNGYVPEGEQGMLDKLRAANIPYNVDWESGCEYPRGGDYFRVLEDGTHSLTEVPSIESQGMVSMHDLFNIIEPTKNDVSPALAINAVEGIRRLAESAKARDFPPVTLIQNGVYL